MRNPFEPRQVTSRRGGPAKPPLSQDAIVNAALALLVREGPEGMSLRKVASALETGAASLYAYVESLGELQALLAQGGIATGTAAWASDLLLLYVTALAAEQSERRKQSNPLGPAARVMETMSGD